GSQGIGQGIPEGSGQGSRQGGHGQGQRRGQGSRQEGGSPQEVAMATVSPPTARPIRRAVGVRYGGSHGGRSSEGGSHGGWLRWAQEPSPLAALPLPWGSGWFADPTRTSRSRRRRGDDWRRNLSSPRRAVPGQP